MEPLLEGSTGLIMQAGFGGLCLILLGIVIWLIRSLLGVIKESNVVISSHTEVSHGILESLKDAKEQSGTMRDELIKRPCMSNNRV